ncbi:MAG TPA: hypothetical protein VJR03_07220 [Nitrospira sp.]|nr:hypothetical protein [Nitrospira sp.]
MGWGTRVLLVAGSLALAYLLAALIFLIRWIHFWIRGPHFLPYLAVMLTAQALLLLWWTSRHHKGRLRFLSTTIYSMAGGYVAGVTALVLYPIFQPDGLVQVVNALRFPTIDAGIAFFWFPVRLLTWTFGGISGVMLTVLSRRLTVFEQRPQ